MRREDAKEIHKFIIDTIKKEKYSFITDNKLDLGSPTIGSLLARKVSVVDTNGNFIASDLESVLQEVVSGCKLLDVISISGEYYVSPLNDLVICSGEIDIYLPSAIYNVGKVIYFKNLSTSTISIWGIDGQMIDNAEYTQLTTLYSKTAVVSNGSNWYIIV